MAARPEAVEPSAAPHQDASAAALPLLLQVKEELRQVLREEHRRQREWTTSWGLEQQQQMEEYTQSVLRLIEKKQHGRPKSHGKDQGVASRAWDAIMPGHSRGSPSPTSPRSCGATFAGTPGFRSTAASVDSGSGLEPARHPFEVLAPAPEGHSTLHLSESEDEVETATAYCSGSPSNCRCREEEAEAENRPSLVSDDVAKEMDREEWTAHLRRRVSQQLTEKDFQIIHHIHVGQGLMGRVVEHHVFQFFCASVIVVNALFAGYTCDVGMGRALLRPALEDPDWFQTANTIFTVCYVAEVTMRIWAYRKNFFVGPDWRWNALDTVLVFSSVVEQIFQDVGLGSLRVIRGLRMFRVLRIIRVMRFFRDLRLMVCSVMQSLASLSWALLLLLIIMYLFSVFFMQGAIMHFRGDDVAEGAALREGVRLYYETVTDTMYTLLGAITGGLNWVDVVRPLEEISLFYRILFAFYVVFVVIGVLNVLTGIFVERANELSGLDKDLVIQSEMKRNETFLVEMRRIFEEADADGSGTISWDEFKGYLKNDRVKAYLATQQLDAFDARTLFDILNVSEGEEIGIDEFIVGCMRLKGMAKSVDLVAVLQETRAMGQRLKALTRDLERRDGNVPGLARGTSHYSKANTLGAISLGSDTAQSPARK